MDPEAVTCSLTGDDLAQRIEEWRRVAARATRRAVEDDSVVSAYPRDPGLLVELRRLVDAERDCCSFMDFRIEEQPDQVVLRLSVPPDMRHMLPLIVGLVTRDSDLVRD